VVRRDRLDTTTEHGARTSGAGRVLPRDARVEECLELFGRIGRRRPPTWEISLRWPCGHACERASSSPLGRGAWRTSQKRRVGPPPNTSPWVIMCVDGSEEVAVGSLELSRVEKDRSGGGDLTALVNCIRVRVNSIIADRELVPYCGRRSVELGSGRDARGKGNGPSWTLADDGGVFEAAGDGNGHRGQGWEGDGGRGVDDGRGRCGAGTWMRRPLRREASGPVGLEARVGVGHTKAGATLKVLPSAGAGRSELESMKESEWVELLLLRGLDVLGLR
jgi:hypothetical protein